MLWLTNPQGKPWRCRRCGRVIGHTTETRLTICLRGFRKPVTVDCICGAKKTWRPR